MATASPVPGYMPPTSTEDPAEHISRYLAPAAGSSAKVVAELLAELEGAGVFRRTDEGIIYCPRMLNEAEELRAEGWCPGLRLPTQR